jgi:hypothetical protein
MNSFDHKNSVLMSSAILFKYVAGVHKFFIIKEPGSEKWEFVKLLVRKGESSVRAVIRIMGEKGAMTVRVLEEAGRYKSAATTNGKTLTQNNIYYIMLLKSSSKEAKVFGEIAWLDYAKAIKKLTSKKEASMLKSARDIIKEWERKRKMRRLQNP